MTSPALRDALEAAVLQERRRIADALEAEGESLPCREDGEVYESAAWLVRGDFSYNEAERLELAEERHDIASALRANSSDVRVPREAWDLWRAECQKPQFFTQTSGGGKASVEFTYHGEGALKRAQAMHSALTAIALAAGSASPHSALQSGKPSP